MVKFHFYKGKSIISKIIKWKTGGNYSHVSIEIDGTVYEAWEKNGVIKSNDPLAYHTPGTPINTLQVEMKKEKLEEFKLFLIEQLGKKYDWKAILFGFVKNKKIEDKNRWFCSELADMFFTFQLGTSYNLPKKLVSPQLFFEKLDMYNTTLKMQEKKELI